MKGTTGVATAWGVQHYLKYWCNAHVSWSGDQLNLSHPLPPVDGTVIVNSPHRFCLVPYSQLNDEVGIL